MTVGSTGSSSYLAQLRQYQQAAFKTADADGDGRLSLTEFQSIGQNVQGSDGQKGPSPMRGGCGPGGHFSGDTLSALLSTQSVDDLAGSLMAAGDADGDGKMTASELSSALAAKAPDGATGQGVEDKMASDIISALDTDGDGSLSSSEISTAITNAAADQSSAQAMQGHHHHHHHGPPPAEATDEATTLASATQGSTTAADLMQKLLAQLDSATAGSSASESSNAAVGGGAGVTA